MLSIGRFPAATLIVLLAGVGVSVEAEEPAAGAEALVQQLRDDDYDTRQAAADKLAALGEAARAALEKAVASQDAEWRKAAQKVLTRLDVAGITVLAFDRDGKAAAGAQASVRFFMLPGGAPVPKQGQTITIGKDGSAFIGGLTPGDTVVELQWQRWSYVLENRPYGPLHLERGANAFFWRLQEGGTLTFRVKDAEGRAIKGARAYRFPASLGLCPELLDMQVEWLRPRMLEGQDAAETDMDGVVKVSMPQGLYQCVVLLDGYAPCLVGSFRMDERASVELPAAVLTKSSNGKLAFTVVQADGTPLRHASPVADVERVFEGPKAADLTRRARVIRQRSTPRKAPRTDEAGRVALDNLVPGTYRLMVSEGGVRWQADGCVVTGGQTTDAGVLKSVPVGAIKGAVFDGGGGAPGHYFVQAVPEQTLSESLEGVSFPDWNAVRECFARGSRGATEMDGGYEVRGLLPGRYAVAVTLPSNDERPVIICGVQVAAGQSEAVPDAVIGGAAAPAAGIAQPGAQALKGTVLLPDGKPAAGARVAAYFAAGVVKAAQCSRDGAFVIDASGFLCAGAHLVVKAHDCRPATVELDGPNVKLGSLDVRLEPQRYGSVRVKVVDDAGKPLARASVVPYWTRRASDVSAANPSLATRKATTNAEGGARLSGLAAGERRLAVQCDGYYLTGEPKVTVEADAEAQATVTMTRGLRIAGRVEWPEGCEHTNTVVMLYDGRRYTRLAKDDGSFDFGAFPPGDYYVTAAAPGLAVAEPAHVRLTADAAPPDVRLKLVRPAGAVLDVGLDGATVTLVPKGKAESALVASNTSWAELVFSGRADSAGRAEFWGLPAGDYDVLAVPEIEKRAPMSRRWSSFTPRAMSLPGGTVTAAVLKSAAELRTLPSAAVRLEKGTACVYGRIACDKEFAAKYSGLGQLDIKLLGATAMACYTVSYPDGCRQDTTRRVQVLRAPAESPLARLAQSGMFAFEGVPAGEYKVVGELRLFTGIQAGGLRAEQKMTPVPLATLTVKPNEPLDAGTLRFDPPADMPVPQETATDWRRAAEPDDQAPVHRP